MQSLRPKQDGRIKSSFGMIHVHQIWLADGSKEGFGWMIITLVKYLDK